MSDTASSATAHNQHRAACTREFRRADVVLVLSLIFSTLPGRSRPRRRSRSGAASEKPRTIHGIGRNGTKKDFGSSYFVMISWIARRRILFRTVTGNATVVKTIAPALSIEK